MTAAKRKIEGEELAKLLGAYPNGTYLYSQEIDGTRYFYFEDRILTEPRMREMALQWLESEDIWLDKGEEL